MVNYGITTPKVLQLPTCRMSADAVSEECPKTSRYAFTHYTSVFHWARGVSAKVFRVVGEAESGLFDGFRREIVEFAGS